MRGTLVVYVRIPVLEVKEGSRKGDFDVIPPLLEVCEIENDGFATHTRNIIGCVFIFFGFWTT